MCLGALRGEHSLKVARRARAGQTFPHSRRRDRINLVLWRSLDKGGGGTTFPPSTRWACVALHTPSEALVSLCCSGSKAKQSMNIELSKSGLRSGSTLLHSEPDIMALQIQTGSPDGADTQLWPPSHSGKTAFADTNARPEDPVGSQSFALTPVTRKSCDTWGKCLHSLCTV